MRPARSRQLAPLALAAIGSASMATIQVLVGVVGANDVWSAENAALFLTFLASFQAGITVAQQSLLHERPNTSLLYGLFGIAALLAVSAGVGSDLPAVARAVLVVLSGGGLGVWAGDHNVRVLVPELRFFAQARNALRGLLWVGAASFLLMAATRLAESWELLALLGGGFAAILTTELVASTRRSDADRRRVVRFLPGAAVTGLVAALIYRNDVSILRIRAADASFFESLNLGIAAYSMANGLAGLILGTIVLPEVRVSADTLRSMSKRAIRSGRVAVVVSALLSLPFIPQATDGASAGIVVVAAIPVSLAVTFSSLCAHVYKRSISVYLTSSFATLALLLLPVDAVPFGLGVSSGAQVLVMDLVLSRAISDRGPSLAGQVGAPQ